MQFILFAMLHLSSVCDKFLNKQILSLNAESPFSTDFILKLNKQIRRCEYIFVTKIRICYAIYNN